MATNSPKVVIPTVGSLGDVLPCILLGDSLKKAGYHVTIVATPKYQKRIEEHGLEWADIVGDIEYVMSETKEGQEVSRNPSLLKIGALKGLFNPLVEKWFTAMHKTCSDADYIIYTIPTLASGYSLAEANPKIKCAVLNCYPNTPTNSFAAPMLGSAQSWFGFMNSLKWKLQDTGAWSLSKDTINRLRKEVLNLPPTTDFRGTITKWGMPSLTLYSQALLPRPKDWPANEYMLGPILCSPNEFEKPERVTKFLESGDAPVYIGMGSTMSIMFDAAEQHQLIGTWVQGLEQLNRRGLINLQGFSQVDQFLASQPERANILFVTQNISHEWLFPQCRSVVHHGGAGTTHTGIRYGLPTFILPVAADQPFNGDIIHRNNMGPEPVPIRKLTLKKFVKGLTELEKPLYRETAQKAAEKMKTENVLETAVKILTEHFSATEARA
jgi:sterol 3beta-glucosyltransferase